MVIDGKVALITGAARGIGRAVSLRLASEGYRVAVTGRSKERCDNVVAEILGNGGEAASFILNVSKEDEAEAAVAQILSLWGQIDILVNNAGILWDKCPTWSTTLEEWDTIMGVNLRGVFLCSQVVLPSMMSRRTGVIINIGSSSGRTADGEYGAYAASKWGVVGYTMSLARSLREYGIQVNGINPGWVDTDMARSSDPNGGLEGGSTPDDIARVVSFLAAHAPPDMTGQFIDVFGS